MLPVSNSQYNARNITYAETQISARGQRSPLGNNWIGGQQGARPDFVLKIL